MRHNENREKRWEEKLRQEKEQDDERTRRRSRLLLLMIAAVILFTAVPIIAPDLFSSSVQPPDGTVESAADEMPADAVLAVKNTPGSTAVQTGAPEETAFSLSSAVSCQEYLLPEELLFLCVNNNSIPVDINLNVVFLTRTAGFSP